ELIEAFQSTLEETKDVDLLLHVVDASSSNIDSHENTVLDLINDLDMDNIPMLTVYNKKDLVKGEFYPTLFPYIIISAINQEDQKLLIEKIEESIRDLLEKYNVAIPANRGDVLAQLKTETIITNQEYDEESEKYLVTGLTKDADWLDYLFNDL